MITIACRCVGAPHEQDTITLRETLSPRDASAISKDIGVVRLEDPDATVGDILATLTEGYILRGIESWSLVDEDGKPLPVTKANIRDRILSDLEATMNVGDVADELYAEAVMLPLLRQASSSSRPTQTENSADTPEADSTSAPTDSGTTLPTPSTPSSTFTTPTADTGMTYGSPAGDSSFSPTSASAA